DKILQWFMRWLPDERQLATRVWQEVDEQIGAYARGKVMEIFIVGTVSYICFAFLGLNYALLLGVLVGLSVLVPYIGATVVTIPVALVGIIQWGPNETFLYLMIAYFIIQALDGNVLVPLLFSEANNLHPVAIITAVLFFGGIWGFWGVFFAIPLATLVVAVIDAWDEAKSVTIEKVE
ncbi:MAG: AI-2E family transporter, partial [Kangiellaceae bacterium]|nr:AI-2E family transporter [Kangiellaceae bacterium]